MPYSRSEHPNKVTKPSRFAGHQPVHTVSIDRNNQLYMGGLDFSWNESDIRKIWLDLGERLVSVKMMWNNNRPGINGETLNMGYCFIEFESQIKASEALQKSGQEIPSRHGKFLRLNWGSGSNAASASRVNQHSYNNRSKNHQEISLFVGDLAANVSESQISELCESKSIPIDNVKIIYDIATGLSKGFGFIRFNTVEDQQRAMKQLQGCVLNGRQIRLGTAGHGQDLSKDRNAMNETLKTKSNNNQVKPSTKYKPKGVSLSQFIKYVEPAKPVNAFNDCNNTNLLVTNVSSLINEQELLEYFRSFGAVVSIKLIESKNIAFIQFFARQSAEKALLKLQGHSIKGSKISLTWGTAFNKQQGQESFESNTSEIYTPQPSLKPPIFGFDSSLGFLKTNTHANLQKPATALLEIVVGNPEHVFVDPQQKFRVLNGCELAKNVRVEEAPQTDQINDAVESITRLEDGSNGFLIS